MAVEVDFGGYEYNRSNAAFRRSATASHWRWTKSCEEFILPRSTYTESHGNHPYHSQSGIIPPATSIWSRLLNVFTAPGEVFEEVKNSQPSTANWLCRP